MSRFHGAVAENCAVLGYYAASSCDFKPQLFCVITKESLFLNLRSETHFREIAFLQERKEKKRMDACRR
jgi:hypothetical protein